MDDEDEFDEWQEAEPVSEPQLIDEAIVGVEQVNEGSDEQKNKSDIDEGNEDKAIDKKMENLTSKEEEVDEGNKNKNSEVEEYCKETENGENENVRVEHQIEQPVSNDETPNNETEMDYREVAPENEQSLEQKESNTNFNFENHLAASSHNSQNSNNEEWLGFSEVNKTIKMLNDQKGESPEQQVTELGKHEIKNDSKNEEEEANESIKLEYEEPIVLNNFDSANLSKERKEIQMINEQLSSETVEGQNFEYEHEGMIQNELHQENEEQEFDKHNNDEDEFGDYEEESNVIETPVGPPIIASSSSLVSSEKQIDPEANNKAMDFISKLPNYSYINASYFVDL